MEHFKVSPRIGINTESYWVGASSPEAARRLIALNIPKASDAENPAKFDCVANSHKEPAEGIIHCSHFGPLTIQTT
jgi:hypothetical protein